MQTTVPLRPRAIISSIQKLIEKQNPNQIKCNMLKHSMSGLSGQWFKSFSGAVVVV